MSKVLVRATNWLGDAVMSLPAIRDIPRHQRFYYLELLRRAGMIERFPISDEIRLDGIADARKSGAAHLAALGISGPAIGISPGAAYGNAKRWLPERFAETAARFKAPALVFGSQGERPLCEVVSAELRRDGVEVRNLAGQTTLREFI